LATNVNSKNNTQSTIINGQPVTGREKWQKMLVISLKLIYCYTALQPYMIHLI